MGVLYADGGTHLWCSAPLLSLVQPPPHLCPDRLQNGAKATRVELAKGSRLNMWGSSHHKGK